MNTKKQQAIAFAKQYNIALEVGGGRHYEVMLSSPDGFCFEDDLHTLVTEADESQKNYHQNVWSVVLKDLKFYAPRMKPCPPDCFCKDNHLQ